MIKKPLTSVSTILENEDNTMYKFIELSVSIRTKVVSDYLKQYKDCIRFRQAYHIIKFGLCELRYSKSGELAG